MSVVNNLYEQLKFNFPREELQLLLESGYTYRDLQNKYNFNERLFSRLAKEYDIPKDFKKITINANSWHKINFNMEHVLHLYYNLNKSLRYIAKIYECSHCSVVQFFHDNNIPIRNANSIIYYKDRIKSYSRHKSVDSGGYITLSISGETIREHRYIMQNHLKRTLSESEYVHHIDFIKTNNDINNLFIFNGNSIHLLYHKYIEKNSYISPSDFLIYYEDNLKNTFENYDWIYEQYIENCKSCEDISKEIKLSRTCVARKIKEFGIYNLRSPIVNQHDKRSKCE